MKTFATRKSLYGMVTAAALSLLIAGPAMAQDGTTATVNGGSLTITTPAAADFADRDITGADQTTTAALAVFSVSDFTGTGDGWSISAEADQFTGVGHDLAVGSLTMSQPTVAPNGTTSPDPEIVTGPYLLDGGSAVPFADAAIDEGMGTYDFSATTLTLALPADVFAGAYDSTVTVSIVSAP